MVVTNNAKNRIRDLLSADISSSSLGTGTTSPTAGDTAMEAEDVTTNATPTQTTGNKIVNSKHIMLSTIGNGTTYTEFAVKMNSDGTLLNRVVFPGFSQTANTELHTTTVYRIL